jgi:uncharacterized protein involved in outer membrane biogenesis
MRLRTILLLILLLVLAVPVIGAVALWWVDESVYRRLIAQRVEQATGRKLAIDGELHLALAARPTLAVERVTLANAPWASRPAMATLDRLELRFGALSLLAGRPEIDRVRLIGPKIHLETAPDGRHSWELARREPAPTPPEGDGQAAPAGGNGAAFPIVRELVIEGGGLTYRDGRSGAEHVLALDRVQILHLQPTAPASLQLAGAVDGLPLAIEGQAGPLAAWQAGERVPIELAGRIAGIATELKGTVANPAKPSADLAFRFQAADPAAMAGHLPEPLAVRLARLVPLDLQGRLAGDRRRLVLSGLTLLLAQSRLGGDATLDLAGPRPRLDATLAADRLDLRPLLSGDGAAGGSAGAPGTVPGPLFSREPLPFAALRAADAALRLRIGTLATGKLDLEDVALTAQLADGRLQLDPAGFTLAGRQVGGSLAVDARGDPARVRLALAADGLDLGTLLEQLAVTSLLEGRGDLRATLAASGPAPHDLARTLAGQVSLLMAGGGLRTAVLDRLTGGAPQAVAALLGRPAADVARLRCLALAVPIADGVARPDLVLDTELSTVVGAGTVDLGRERLDLTLAPRAKVASLNLSVPVRIEGPLREPRFGIDEKDAARRLGTLLGAAIFPREVLGSFADLGEAGGKDCLAIGADPARLRAPVIPGLPAGVLENPDKALGAAKDALGRAGRGLLQDLLRGR